MRFSGSFFVSILAFAAICAQVGRAQSYGAVDDGRGPNVQAEAEQLFALGNQSRLYAGLERLQWDPALTAAALKHCLRMAQEGQIAHRYGGEEDLSVRAGHAGAHFSVIEENVAVGPSANKIHEMWMASPGHRENLLSGDVDHVGIAVVAARGVLYAVADFSQIVRQMSLAQVEERVSGLVAASGVTVLQDPGAARAACIADRGMPRSTGGMQPQFVMRWQDAILTRLPQQLIDRLETGSYRMADVGACPPQDVSGDFTAYRIAVILY
jgi:uncharacterized protein YkwD